MNIEETSTCITKATKLPILQHMFVLYSLMVITKWTAIGNNDT